MAFIGATRKIASRGQREYIVCSSTENSHRYTVRFRARGSRANSLTEPWCQLCQGEAISRGRAERDQGIEIYQVKRVYRAFVRDGTAESGEPLNEDAN